MNVGFTGYGKTHSQRHEASGHDISLAVSSPKSKRALQTAEKLDPEGDGGFNPRIKPIESTRALAPEERILPISPENRSFSAACLAPEGMLSVASDLIRASLVSCPRSSRNNELSS
jgi:hypothetical protein